MDQHLLIITILTLGIIILGIIWLLTRPKYRSFNETFITKDSLFRLSSMIIGITLSLLSTFYFPLPKKGDDFILVPLGIVFFTIGYGLALWAKITMQNYWGMPAQHDIRKQSKLVTTGPFTITRNPIYVGLLLVFFGYSLAIKSVFVVLIFVYFYFVNKAIQKEEQLLEKYFGKEYLEYKEKVPRFLRFK